jgi:hypothetical protein
VASARFQPIAGIRAGEHCPGMKIDVRSARVSDLDAMVSLIEARRAAYEPYQPIFWRRAKNSARSTRLYYRFLLWRRSSVVLVACVRGSIAGFLIARVSKAPPVYDPGGPTATIDDFAVGSDAWMTVGDALLSAALSIGRRAGWRQVIVVCGAHDEPKTAFLRDRGLGVTTNWWTMQI